MKVKYIRRDIPEEISEEGGAYIQLVGKDTIGLTESIKEAIRTLYCVGEASLIEGYFKGLCRSVFAGIKADGAARCIGDLRFFPVCGGTFDLDKGWDPLVNDVRIYAQLVNGVTLDVTDWTFEDVTPGRVAFSIESVSDGTTAGIVTTNKNAEINGKNFPEEVSVSLDCGTTHIDVPASAVTRSVSRIDIDKSALANLPASGHGQPVVVTIKGGYNKATKTATVHYVEPTPEITKAKQGDRADNTVGFGTTSTVLTGKFPGGLKATDGLKIDGAPTTPTGADYQATMSLIDYVTASTETTITLGNGFINDSGEPDSAWNGKNARFVLIRDGEQYELVVSFSAA